MKINKEVQKILDEICGALPTCSLKNLKPNSITFNKKANIIIANPLEEDLMTFIDVDNAEWTFWNYHNWYWSNYVLDHKIIKIGFDCKIDETAVVGVDGIGRIKYNGEYIDQIHTGDVVFGERVTVGPYSIIRRGVLDNTIIGSDVYIDALSVIGRNNQIGDRTFIASGVSIGGSVEIGKDCFIYMGAAIRDNITICDNVFIGMGSVVTKDINREGKWYGNPARYHD